MDKLLICINIPSIGKKYDLFVPEHLPVIQVIPLLAKALQEATAGEYVSSGEEILCCQEPFRILTAENTLVESGVQNGDILLIF